MIFNLKDIDMNNYVSWVYNELTYVKTAVNELIEECQDIDLLYLVIGLIIKEKEDANQRPLINFFSEKL